MMHPDYVPTPKSRIEQRMRGAPLTYPDMTLRERAPASFYRLAGDSSIYNPDAPDAHLYAPAHNGRYFLSVLNNGEEERLRGKQYIPTTLFPMAKIDAVHPQAKKKTLTEEELNALRFQYMGNNGLAVGVDPHGQLRVMQYAHFEPTTARYR